MGLLDTFGHVAAIGTAVVAAVAACCAFRDRRAKRKRLEEYLKLAKANAKQGERGQKSVTHLMAKCGLTYDEVLNAANSSNLISGTPKKDRRTRFADGILFEYVGP